MRLSEHGTTALESRVGHDRMRDEAGERVRLGPGLSDLYEHTARIEHVDIERDSRHLNLVGLSRWHERSKRMLRRRAARCYRTTRVMENMAEGSRQAGWHFGVPMAVMVVAPGRKAAYTPSVRGGGG